MQTPDHPSIHPFRWLLLAVCGKSSTNSQKSFGRNAGQEPGGREERTLSGKTMEAKLSVNLRNSAACPDAASAIRNLEPELFHHAARSFIPPSRGGIKRSSSTDATASEVQSHQSLHHCGLAQFISHTNETQDS